MNNICYLYDNLISISSSSTTTTTKLFHAESIINIFNKK